MPKPDARLEPDQHRVRDEVGHEAETQDEGQQQNGADEQRQHRQGARERCVAAMRGDFAKLGADKYRERRGRADTQWPRTAEECVDQHWHQRGVEPRLQGQARNGGVRPSHRYNHRGRGQTGDQIGFQPRGVIADDPIWCENAKTVFQHHATSLLGRLTGGKSRQNYQISLVSHGT